MPRSDLRPGHARGFGILGCLPQFLRSILHATVWPQTRTCKGSRNFGAAYPRFPKVLCMPRSDLRPGHARGLGILRLPSPPDAQKYFACHGLTSDQDMQRVLEFCWAGCLCFGEYVPSKHTMEDWYFLSPTSILGLWKKLSPPVSLVLGNVSVYVCLRTRQFISWPFFVPMPPWQKHTKAILFHGYFPDVKRNACYPSISAFRSGLLKSSLQVLKKLPGHHVYIYNIFISTNIYISFLLLFFVFIDYSKYIYRIIHKYISLQRVFTPS